MIKEEEIEIEIEGEETLDVLHEETKKNDIKEIYPININIDRDFYSIYDLKRKFEERQTLILDPDFQRNEVWTKKQNSELVESILMGIPLPAMYFAEDKLGNLQVIDGRQRLTALFSFLNNEFTISSAPILEHIKRKKFKVLEPKEKAKLEDYQLLIYIIKPQTPDRIKFDIFDRVNRGGTQLNKQEMRNALYQGESTILLRELADLKEFKRATDRSLSSRRMKDRYLILRFIGFYLYYTDQLLDKEGKKIQYKSNIDEFLGKVMDYLNSISKEKIKELKLIFISAMENTTLILGENSFRIPNIKKKRPLNMALFECLSYLMCFNTVEDKNRIVKEKINLLLLENEFLTSLTKGIDSSKSVKIRFNKMNEIIEELKNG